MESVTGSAADLAVSIVGDDLVLMRGKMDSLAHIVRAMQGSEGVDIEQEGAQDQLAVKINRDQAARFGINDSDIQNMVEAAVGGKNNSVLSGGAKRYDIIIRYYTECRSKVN